MALKKELEIYHKDGSALYSLRFVKGGELPDELKTQYTSSKEAARARNHYYNRKQKKAS